MARIEFKPNPAAAANGIKFPGGGSVSASLQTLQDPGNNSLPIAVSNSAVTFGTGTITSNGVVTIKGAGSNVISFRNSSNVEIASILNAGHIQGTADVLTSSATGQFKINDTKLGRGGADGIFQMMNNAENDFTRLIFGANSTSGVSIRKSGTTIVFSLGNASANISITAKDYTSDNLSTGILNTARPFKVGDRGSITEASFVAMGLNTQIAVELNGTVYYIPAASSIIP